jgi:hypothetical protein
MGSHPILNPKDRDDPALGSGALPDPLVIMALEEVTRGFDEPGPCFISFDDVSKFNFGGGQYNVRLPDKRADVIFEDRKRITSSSICAMSFAGADFPGGSAIRTRLSS